MERKILAMQIITGMAERIGLFNLEKVPGLAALRRGPKERWALIL